MQKNGITEFLKREKACNPNKEDKEVDFVCADLGGHAGKENAYTPKIKEADPAT